MLLPESVCMYVRVYVCKKGNTLAVALQIPAVCKQSA